jgi:hypothetical protein
MYRERGHAVLAGADGGGGEGARVSREDAPRAPHHATRGYSRGHQRRRRQGRLITLPRPLVLELGGSHAAGLCVDVLACPDRGPLSGAPAQGRCAFGGACQASVRCVGSDAGTVCPAYGPLGEKSNSLVRLSLVQQKPAREDLRVRLLKQIARQGECLAAALSWRTHSTQPPAARFARLRSPPWRRARRARPASTRGPGTRHAGLACGPRSARRR